ncbi:ROK family protein [Zongyangia hominis]|uniref:ROK family protein n=1 Tax=Zongyangia hominis TaxID=2763677 RepID=A0A926ICD5_9FIRM|nr:ROK family protein [Zongyangia hominis]MBC8571233.1 ROK family protein [Zongyangia hominis]
MGNIISLKIRNTVNALALIKREGPITKNEISKKIGITSVSSHNIVNDLLDQNVIREATDTSNAVTSGGRKAVSYELNPDFGMVVGQRMVLGRIETGLYDFQSACIAYRERRVSETNPDVILRLMVDEIQELLEENGIVPAQVIGAGVTWPGQVNDMTGVILNLPNIPGYRGLEAKLIMEQRLGFPVYIGNDVKGMVLALKWMGYCGTDSLAYFSSGPEGVGCGVINEGRLLSGFNHNAGELAHIQVDFHGKMASFEQILLYAKVIDRCRAALKEAGEAVEEDFDLDAMVDLANEGSEPVLRVLREALSYIKMCMDILVKLLDPHFLLWQVEWLARIPALRQELEQIVRESFSNVSYCYLQIQMCDIDRLSTLGAAALLFDNFFTNKTSKNRLFAYNSEILSKRE